MTDSDQAAYVWPALPPPGPEWKRVAGYSRYEWSHRGRVRSAARPEGMRTRLNNSGYVIVNVTSDAGVKETVLLHRMILRAHVRELEPGEETLHGPGGQTDNRWPENIRIGSHEVNVWERVAAQPPKPVKPPTPCVNFDDCGGYVTHGGRRCHPCVEGIGIMAANMLANGMDLDKVGDELEYPSHAGLIKLAKRYGGLELIIVPNAGDPPSPRHWLRSVIIRWKAWLADSDAR